MKGLAYTVHTKLELDGMQSLEGQETLGGGDKKRKRKKDMQMGRGKREKGKKRGCEECALNPHCMCPDV